MLRQAKQQKVTEASALFNGADLVVVMHLSGLDADETTAFRRAARAQGTALKVIKNRLALRALEGTKFEPLAPLFKGPTAVAVSNDPLAAAKVVVKFANENDKVKILGGYGTELLNAQTVVMLGNLPSLDELRGKIVGLLQAPAAQLARVFKAYGESTGSTEPASS